MFFVSEITSLEEIIFNTTAETKIICQLMAVPTLYQTVPDLID